MPLTVQQFRAVDAEIARLSKTFKILYRVIVPVQPAFEVVSVRLFPAADPVPPPPDEDEDDEDDDDEDDEGDD